LSIFRVDQYYFTGSKSAPMTRKDELKDPPDKLTGPEEDHREAVKWGGNNK
jgi:hypothetical protein